MPLSRPADEAAAVRERYSRRAGAGRYSMLRPDVWQTQQERQRAMLQLFARLGWTELASRRVLEVGCGGGGNLVELLRLGFAPAHLAGVELLAERYAAAREVLPDSTTVVLADATELELDGESQDIVYVSTVFSSLLNDEYQTRLADAMWRWVKPGGGVLWYDFTINNPRNPDVRGVPVARIRSLFPAGKVETTRVTLAPPLARGLCRIHPMLYTLANSLPLLRTHVLAWIAKPLVVACVCCSPFIG
jgi:SAM-dependent methyltransferase